MKSITFKKLKEFGKEHSPEPVNIVMDTIEYPFVAMAHYYENPKLIRFDKKFWNHGGKHKNGTIIPPLKTNPENAKSIMLHELGHIAEKHDMTKVRKIGWINTELDAQLWAIKKTKEINDKKLIKECINYFKKWNNLKIFAWNSHRRYILARRKFLNENMRY